MIAAVRIRGRVKVPKKIKDTLYLLRLRHKYVCSIYKESKEILGMLEKVKYYIAYGNIKEETLISLIKKRGRKKGNRKLNEEEVNRAMKLVKEGKGLKEIGFLKPFFRLNPPKGGFKKSTKQLYPKGTLGFIGNEINKLIVSML